ncbi:LysR family transcriptional regulator [Streptomyces scabiei]|uniref:LysR family transcriptional regulator n=1 Tax=Streptomyces scabiei TaxID=1930 RepID=UPI0024A78032|nr:LysR family transcriptional regulator [Streptomyces sp. LBUM 1475]
MTLDLNLLVPLDALLQERSVTRAAQRLGLSQPSLSAALARLRRHYGDELLVRVGNSYELTPWRNDWWNTPSRPWAGRTGPCGRAPTSIPRRPGTNSP